MRAFMVLNKPPHVDDLPSKPLWEPRLFGHKISLSGQIGLAIILINLAFAFLAPILAPYPEADVVGSAWALPNAEHWLGLDNLGRDLLSRRLFGARLSIGLALIITMLSFTLGICLGFTAAIMGDVVDMVLSRIVDLLLALPTLIFACVILAVLGTDLPVLIGTIAVLDSTRVFRIARAVAMDMIRLDYVEVARLRGEKLGWILTKEILPNAAPTLLAEFGLRFCFTFLFIAALSFLGLGVQPPHADWGSMVKDYRDVLYLGLLAPFYPAGAIAILTIGVNFFVDWLLSIDGKNRMLEP